MSDAAPVAPRHNGTACSVPLHRRLRSEFLSRLKTVVWRAPQYDAASPSSGVNLRSVRRGIDRVAAFQPFHQHRHVAHQDFRALDEADLLQVAGIASELVDRGR